jgi:peptidoglycan/LPS O-acetylase OafA/YrhL
MMADTLVRPKLDNRVTPKAKVFRRDIQGLRALAVVAVVLDHLFGWPLGGFVGVDVFFVISGFLITGHLFREHEKNGRISFADFYRRRAKRILPIATFVLAFTVVASFFVYLNARATGVLWDSVYAFFFAANWHFALDGTDYWANDGLESPVQHFWSLAVEEQFYAVWPWLIVLVLGVGTALGWSRRGSKRTLLIVMFVITALSFVWALFETANSPTWAYFSTFARAWELGIGAVLAVASTKLARMPTAVRSVMGWVGLLGILSAVFLLDESVPFPAPWALLPVSATALVIASGTGGEQRHLYPLTNRVAGYLGDISYSLYLWHWPVIVLLAALVQPGPAYFVIVLCLSVGLSVLSYHFLEDPIRKSNWLDHSPEAERARRRARRKQRGAKSSKWMYTGLGSVAIITAILVTVALTPPVPESVADAQPIPAPLPEPNAATEAPVATDPQSVLSAEISASLQTTSFPDFAPSVDSLGTAAWVVQATGDGCADISSSNVESCATGSGGDLDVAVLGDSFSMAWMPGVRAAYEPLGYTVHPFTRGQCPAFSASVLQDGGAVYPECDEKREWAIDYINDMQPDVVIMGSATYMQSRLASGLSGQSAAVEIEAATAATVSALAPSGARVVILGAPPLGVPLQECVTRVSTPAACISSTTSDWTQSRDAERAAAESSGSTYVDTQRWFCNGSGRCPGFVGNTPVRADAGHMTVQYSERLAPLIGATAIAESPPIQ